MDLKKEIINRPKQELATAHRKLSEIEAEMGRCEANNHWPLAKLGKEFEATQADIRRLKREIEKRQPERRTAEQNVFFSIRKLEILYMNATTLERKDEIINSIIKEIETLRLLNK